MSDIRRNKQ